MTLDIQYYVRLWHNQWLVILECLTVFIWPNEFLLNLSLQCSCAQEVQSLCIVITINIADHTLCGRGRGANM